MQRDEILRKIRESQSGLLPLGVAHAWIFGSFARGQETGDSDVDVVVDTHDGSALGLFALARVETLLEQVLGRPVDVISCRGLESTSGLKTRVHAEMINAF
ncbi:MAG TPA: nucleotidyltransferase domain-containing protein [Micropepsaceae bacterium]|nr:nucleotidyltransferase domain-containing protein [Micropepsaceae bacterium]